MATVEPVAGEPAAVAEADGERLLVVADYHAGYETALRAEGVELRNRGDERREHLLSLVAATDPDRVVFLGDLGHWIGRPEWGELDELEALVAAVTERVPALLVKGNHDGEIEDALSIPVTDSRGARVGDVGFVHGHTWPSAEVLEADVVCVGHEHPTVRLEDAVGGRRIERAWLRGRLAGEAFAEHLDGGDDDGDASEGEATSADAEAIDGELVVFPAFNELVGGTWVNVQGQEFLAPFLPRGMSDGEAFLLDGTRLGDYRKI